MSLIKGRKEGSEPGGLLDGGGLLGCVLGVFIFRLLLSRAFQAGAESGV